MLSLYESPETILQSFGKKLGLIKVISIRSPFIHSMKELEKTIIIESRTIKFTHNSSIAGDQNISKVCVRVINAIVTIQFENPAESAVHMMIKTSKYFIFILIIIESHGSESEKFQPQPTRLLLQSQRHS